jgi:hypothetical protein
LNQKYYIYALTEPDGVTVRYIGITKHFRHRLTRHICDARTKGEKNHRICWIRSLMYKEQKPCILLIEETEDILRERFWIEHYRSLGCDLVNASNGCESHIGYTISEKTREAVSKAKKGKPISESHRQALIRANTGRRMPEHVRLIVIENNRNRKSSASHCVNGHEYTADNTRINKSGYRECKICNSLKKKRYNEKQKKKMV